MVRPSVPSLKQEDVLFEQDPYILGPRSEYMESEYLPGYIRDFDPEAKSVRYPSAAGRLIEKGVGALVRDPLGVLRSAGEGVVDLYNQGQSLGGGLTGLTAALALNQGQGMAESGQRLLSGDYGGMDSKSEDEARLLDLLTVGEAIPLAGIGAMSIKALLRQRVKAARPDLDPAEIESIVEQMSREQEIAGVSGPWGDRPLEDLGPRPEGLSLDEFEAVTAPLSTEVAGDMERYAPGFVSLFNRELSNMGLGTDERFDFVDQALVQRGYRADERRQLLSDVFPDEGDRIAGIVDELDTRDTTAFPDDPGVPSEIADDDYDPAIIGDDDYDPMANSPERAVEDRVNTTLQTEFGRYFGDNDQMTISDSVVGISEALSELNDIGYSDAQAFNFVDEALERNGYSEADRRQLMDELFPTAEPTALEQNILAGLQDLQENPIDFTDPTDVFTVQNPHTGQLFEISPLNPWLNVEGAEMDAIAWELDDPWRPTPPNQLAAMDFDMTGNDTYLNSRVPMAMEELGQTKFGSADQLIAALKGKGVKPSELEARGITAANLGDGPIDLSQSNVWQSMMEEPLKVRILEGPDAAWGEHFTPGGSNYRNTIIALKNPLVTQGAHNKLLGDPTHFGFQEDQMGGPTLVHLRTKTFGVVDDDGAPRTAFHVGEIQSEASQRDRRNTKRNKEAEETLQELENVRAWADNAFEDLGGIDTVTEDLRNGTYERINVLQNTMTALENKPAERIRLQEELASGSGGRLTDRFGSLELFDRNVESLKAQKDRILKHDLPQFDSPEEAVSHLNAFVGRVSELDRQHGLSDQMANMLGPDPYYHNFASAANLVTDMLGESGWFERPEILKTLSDYGLGSLHKTEVVTPLALKQAIEQAIDTNSDYMTLGTGDMTQKMTGGTLEGQREYYDIILPRHLKKLLKGLEEKHKVGMPKIETRKIVTSDGVLEVPAIKITPELKRVFTQIGVDAFRDGGRVTVPEPRLMGLGSMKKEMLG